MHIYYTISRIFCLLMQLFMATFSTFLQLDENFCPVVVLKLVHEPHLSIVSKFRKFDSFLT